MFFLSCYRSQRDLHSFPTRRSSDLWRAVQTSCSRSPTSPCGTSRAGSTDSTSRSGTRTREVESRSEEHTSELQSPYDLVCRLLLEKKNQGIAQSISPCSLDTYTLHL